MSVSAEALFEAPEGALLSDYRDTFAFRKEAPCPGKRWRRQRPSASSPDGWEDVPEPADSRSFASALRFASGADVRLWLPRRAE